MKDIERSQCRTRTLSRTNSLIRVSSVFHQWLKMIDHSPIYSSGRFCFPRLALFLPGRETVAVRGAAASQLGMKNAKIEANGGETQVDGKQKDTTIPILAARIEAKSEGSSVKLVVGRVKILRRSLPRVAGLNPER
jgi:hypothetical protein